MNILNELEEELRSAKKELLAHPYGNLILPIRKRIWKLYDQGASFEHQGEQLAFGHKCRIYLAILAIKKVMKDEDKYKREYILTENIIETVEKYLYGDLSKEVIKVDMKSLSAKVNHLKKPDFIGNEKSLTLGFTAMKMGWLFSEDEELHIYQDDKLMDKDLDAYSWDVPFLASCEYVGIKGAGINSEEGIQRRREYWSWYLTEAVIDAYLSAKS